MFTINTVLCLLLLVAKVISSGPQKLETYLWCRLFYDFRFRAKRRTRVLRRVLPMRLPSDVVQSPAFVSNVLLNGRQVIVLQIVQVVHRRQRVVPIAAVARMVVDDRANDRDENPMYVAHHCVRPMVATETDIVDLLSFEQYLCT